MNTRKDILEFKIGDDTINIETDPIIQKGEVNVSKSGIVVKAADKAFNLAMKTVKLSAEQFLLLTNELDKRPNKIEIEFGLNLSGEIGAYIVKGAATANYKVKLTWEDK